MPTAFTDIPKLADAPRKRWTRAEYERISSDALGHERLELIEGELISKMGKKRPHVSVLALIYPWLVQVFGARFVNVEAPIDVAPEDNPVSEPEPDVIVTGGDLSHFKSSNPSSAELSLVVEIADTTLAFDLTTKTRLYARAGIQDYWVIDIPGRRIIVHRAPRNGAYESLSAYAEHESVSPLAAPEDSLPVRDVFAF